MLLKRNTGNMYSMRHNDECMGCDRYKQTQNLTKEAMQPDIGFSDKKKSYFSALPKPKYSITGLYNMTYI